MQAQDTSRFESGSGDAIDQVLGYCQAHGVGIAVVCNGHQVVAFIASRHDGIAPKDGNALCFMSMEDMSSNFRLLWDNLSKPGVESLFIYKTLRAEGTPLPPEKLSSKLPNYPGIKNRNEQQINLKNLSDLFLFDLASLPENEEEFLRYCYAPTGALSQYSLVSKQILETRFSLLDKQELGLETITAAVRKQGISEEFTEHIVNSPSTSALATAIKRRPILVLGDVGVGKTMFLRNLIKVYAKEEFERSITFYVDFLREPALSSDLSAFVQNRCEAQLRNEYNIDIEEAKFVRDVYRGDLVRFSRGIYSKLKEVDPGAYELEELKELASKIADRAAHLRASLEQIVKSRHRQIVLFLDNIDQRSEEFQEQVYIIAHALAESWPITTFVCLRPDTYYRSLSRGSLAAYQPRVFSITPPRIDAVIVKRLGYALAKLQGEGRMDHFPSHIALHSESLVSYLKAMINSVRKNEELMELIDNFSGRNVRVALGFVATFIGSGHVDSTKIIEAQDSQASGYIIAAHEFLRALIFGDHEHYDPSTSGVCNVFDISIPDPREHFLMLMLLSFIERKADSGEGFASISSIFAFAHENGFQSGQVHASLERAVLKGLLETAPRYAPADRWEAFRITPIGAYTMHKLSRFFAYVDPMIVDTPILDKTVRDQIGNATTISQRIARFAIFLKYLEDQGNKVDWSGIPFDWPETLRELKENLSRVSRAAGVSLPH